MVAHIQPSRKRFLLCYNLTVNSVAVPVTEGWNQQSLTLKSTARVEPVNDLL
jgi:hypothetical protein